MVVSTDRIVFAVAVNKSAQKINHARVRGLLECNAIGKRVQGSPDLGLTIRRGVLDMDAYMVVAFRNAALPTPKVTKVKVEN